ncbi:MAG TPA: hypothetical protein VGC30_07195 [Dokdonella sp.]
MDERTFRDLLAHRWTRLIDPPTTERGAEYLRRGRVLATHYESGEREGALIGMVQGSARDPYVAGVRATQDGERIELDSYCTCPLQFECKHVAAIVLHALRDGGGEAAADDNGSAQLGPWRAWLDALHAAQAAHPRAAPGGRDQGVGGILLRAGDGVVPGLLAQPVRLRAAQRGGFSAEPMRPSWSDPAPWAGLGEVEFRLVAELRMRTPKYVGSSDWFHLRDAADEALLERLLAALPCFFERAANGRLAAGPRRALRIGWNELDDGSQKLALAIDATSPKTRLLQVAGLWYVDPDAHALGRVDGEVRLAEAVLRAPPLLPEQVPLLLERWRDAPLLAALPAPAAGAQIERRRVAPTPVLTLRALGSAGVGGAAHPIGSVRLGFDYAGVRLPVAPVAPRERRRLADRVVEIQRDRARELAAVERLEEVGFVAADLLPRLPGDARDGLDANDFVLEHGRSALAGADQVLALVPRLRDLGFRVESDPTFPFDLLDEPGDADWYAEVDEDATNPWFDLRLGVDLGGDRIDLLPVLHRLLTDPAFPLRPRKGESDDAVWLVPIDARRRLPLPLAKLRELLAPLLE